MPVTPLCAMLSAHIPPVSTSYIIPPSLGQEKMLDFYSQKLLATSVKLAVEPASCWVFTTFKSCVPPYLLSFEMHSHRLPHQHISSIHFNKLKLFLLLLYSLTAKLLASKTTGTFAPCALQFQGLHKDSFKFSLLYTAPSIAGPNFAHH